MAETLTETSINSLPPSLQALVQPISGTAPGGADIAYDDTFLELKAEVDRLGAAGEVDFEKIVALGRTLLRDKSKDLTASAYLTLGLMRTRGVEGLAEGWAVTRVLVEQFWEGLHPQKAVRRRNALQLAADRSRDWLQQMQVEAPGVEERGALVSALASVKALQGLTMASLEENAPALSGVSAALEERLRRVPEPKPEPKPVEKAAPTSAQAPAEATPVTSTPVAAKPAAPAVPAEIASRDDALFALLKVARYFFKEDKANPIPYQLLRSFFWGQFRDGLEHENGYIYATAPDEYGRSYYEQMFQDGLYEDVVTLAEDEFVQDPFYLWLPLQRYVVSSMQMLGPEYETASEVVMLETAAFVRRIPDLLSLSFQDGVPLADPMTVEWIETQVLPQFSGGEGGGVGGGKSDDHVAAQFMEARKLIGTGDLPGALALMQGGEQDRSQADRFRRRSYLAELCIRARQLSMACAILESLDQEIHYHRLDAWDPALTLEVWTALYHSYTDLANESYDSAGALAKAQQILSKISRLDASHALSLLS